VAEVAEQRIHGIAFREALPEGDVESAPVVIAVHGYPESSLMWQQVLPKLAEAGYRALAPDLPGFGDTAADRPGTWERQIGNLDRFRRALGVERTALIVHDWGGLIGLRWACDNPDAVAALVVSNTGFFPDGKWHGMARAMRTEGEGEELVDNANRELFGRTLKGMSSELTDEALDHYFQAYSDEERRRNQLDLYRSGDFEKLEPYEGKLAELGVPMLILWGENDPFAPVAGAYRFRKEVPDAELVVIEDAGHFVVADQPERYAAEVARFLGRVKAG
jgi:haloalkane dehalogenase